MSIAKEIYNEHVYNKNLTAEELQVFDDMLSKRSDLLMKSSSSKSKEYKFLDMSVLIITNDNVQLKLI